MTETVVSYSIEKLPSVIEKDKVKYYIDTRQNNTRFRSRNYKAIADYKIYYYNSSLRKTLHEVRGESRDDCVNTMLEYLAEQKTV